MKQYSRSVLVQHGLRVALKNRSKGFPRFLISFAFWLLLILLLSVTYRLPHIEAAADVKANLSSTDGTSAFEVRDANDQIIARIDSAGHMLIVGSGTINNNFTLTQGSFGLGTSSATSKIDVVNGSVTIRGSGAGLSVAGINNAYFPRSIIVMWSGTLASKPAGWNLCDGTNGTPDLRDRFVYGWTNAVDPGGTGGATTHSHTVNTHSHTLGTHSHTVNPASEDSGWNSAWVAFDEYNSTTWAASISHTHATNIGAETTTTDNGPSGTSAPGTDAVSGLPPYYKLAFLCKQ